MKWMVPGKFSTAMNIYTNENDYNLGDDQPPSSLTCVNLRHAYTDVNRDWIDKT